VHSGDGARVEAVGVDLREPRRCLFLRGGAGGVMGGTGLLGAHVLDEVREPCAELRFVGLVERSPRPLLQASVLVEEHAFDLGEFRALREESCLSLVEQGLVEPADDGATVARAGLQINPYDRAVRRNGTRQDSVEEARDEGALASP
jgi:hypothetical protein